MLQYKRNRKVIWTPEMYERLKELYPTHTNKELEVITGWTTKEMQYRAGVLGVVKTKETECRAIRKIEYIHDHETFIRENFDKMTNKELAAAMGFTIQYIRVKCHGMGLYRMRLEYWTEDQIQYLKDNYQHIGDKELSELFESKWKKNKSWTIKHIEKKRNYLNLKRTKAELQAIQDRNVELGRFKNCPTNRWLKYGVSKDGEIRMWRCQNGRYVPFIKVNGRFTHWARYTWEQANGPVAPGVNIVFKNNDPWEYPKGIEILTAVSDSELSRRNSQISSIGLSDNYIAGMLSHGHPEIREEIRSNQALLDLKRNELLLSRAIKQQQNGRKQPNSNC